MKRTGLGFKGLALAAVFSTVVLITGCQNSVAASQTSESTDLARATTSETAVQIFAAHGFNYARIRVLVSPTSNYGLGQDLTYAIAAAKQAKASGMKVLLDIFYSHWWCDPSQNWKPETWTSQTTLATLKTQVTSYTKSVLTTMKSNGVLPDMVQVGNEVNDGNMWPLGRISTMGWSNYITLQNAGYAAVKSVSSSIPVMTHYAGVGTDCITWYTNFFNKGGKSDVLGVSFYEMWHGNISTCASTLTSLYSKFGKDLYVVETAAYWKASEAGNSTNYAHTQQGQYDYLYALTAKLKTISGVKGLFYWGACWSQSSKWLYAPGWGDDDASCRSLFNDSAVATKAIDAIKNAGGMTVMGVDISEAIKAENAGVDFTD